jgi:hypothetical protein
VTQGAASVLLVNVQKEKEPLRIFMKVPQMEKTIFRSMNLKSFLHGKSRDWNCELETVRSDGHNDW